jgi:alkylation response protein AidB-like acyl-CoA dehydrogenase
LTVKPDALRAPSAVFQSVHRIRFRGPAISVHDPAAGDDPALTGAKEELVVEFELTEEQRMVMEMVRDFGQTEIAPMVKDYEPKGEYPQPIIDKLGELGLLGMMVPEEFSGAGLDTVSSCLAIRELAAACPSTAITLSVTNSVYCGPLINFGTEEQKRKYLEPSAAGNFVGGFALTEPGTGSDASALQAKAEKSEGGYLCNGVKSWVTNGLVGKAFVVLLVTAPDSGSKRLSAFILDPSMKGFRFGKAEEKMGLKSSMTTEIILEDCFVPEENLLGAEGDGLKIALSTLDGARIGVAAQCIGMAQGAFREALAYSQERKTFGRRLAQHQAVQFMLADAATEIEAGNLLMFRAALRKDRGKNHGKEASMAKLFCSEMANRVTSNALQIFGAYGYSREYPVERFFRDARVTTIYEGTSEIQRIVISRALMSN